MCRKGNILISFIIKNINNIIKLNEMGCTFSNQTYLSCQRVGQVIVKPVTENIKIIDKKIQTERVSSLRKKNLRLNRLIVNQNYHSECVSPLQTDRELYCFLGQAQGNLLKSKVCTIQPAKRKNHQIPQQNLQNVRSRTNNNNRTSKQVEKKEFYKQNILDKKSPILDCSQIKVKLVDSLLLEQNTFKQIDQNQNSHSPEMLKIGQLRSIELQCGSPSTKQTNQNNNCQQFDLQVFLRSIVKQQNKVSSCNVGKIRNQRVYISKRQNGSLNDISLNIIKESPLSTKKCYQQAKNQVENRVNNTKLDGSLSNRVIYRKSKLRRNQNSNFQENQALKEYLEDGFQNSQRMNYKKMSLKDNQSLRKEVKSNKQFRIKNSQSCLKTQRNTKKIL